MVLVLRLVAFHAVAVGREGRASHAMAVGAGGPFRLGHAMLGLAVVEGRPRLRKDLVMANGAFAVDPFKVQLMGERRLAVLVVENDGLGRGNIGAQRGIRFRYGSSLRRRLEIGR